MSEKETKTMCETEATFSGTRLKTLRVFDDYRIVTGRGNSAKEALGDMEVKVFRRVGCLPYTPVGGATVLYDNRGQEWVAYQAFVRYDDKEFKG
jgi:hypothetical protein